MNCSRDNIAVVIVGGGASRRYGSGNKLLTLLKGVPLFVYSLRNLAACAAPGNLIFVVPSGQRELFAEAADRFVPELEITWVDGGNSRPESVRNGLGAVSLKQGVVAIHDAARPLADANLLEALLQEMGELAGIIPGKPVTDTIKRCMPDRIIQETVDRTPLWRVETPQLFDVEKLRMAYASLGDAEPTDDAGVMEMAGFPVKIYRNSEMNLKLTYPEEFRLLEELI